MKKIRYKSIYLLTILALAWFFVGIEIIDQEHSENYEFFIKKHPSLNLFFHNTALCGECDLRPLDLMSKEDISRFVSFCSAKFGDNDIQACHQRFE